LEKIMFVIVYHKTTKKLIHHRHDMNVPQTLTAQYWFDVFLSDNEVGDENYAFAEVPFTKALNDIVIGNHVFNETTGQVEADPNYVAPTPDPIPVQPIV